jgi:hypothetical protein
MFAAQPDNHQQIFIDRGLSGPRINIRGLGATVSP